MGPTPQVSGWRPRGREPSEPSAGVGAARPQRKEGRSRLPSAPLPESGLEPGLPHPAPCNFHPHWTRTGGGQERPRRSLGLLGGEGGARPTQERSRPSPIPLDGNPLRLAAARAVPPPGRPGAGGRGRRVRNSRGRPHGAGLTPFSRSRSGGRDFPGHGEGGRCRGREGMPGTQALSTRLPSVGALPRPPALMGPALISAPPPARLSLPARVSSRACVCTSRVSASSDPRKQVAEGPPDWQSRSCGWTNRQSTFAAAREGESEREKEARWRLASPYV